MEMKDVCVVLLDKGYTKKMKCYKFFHKELKRELAIHENVDSKYATSVSDVKTGYLVVGFNTAPGKITMEAINSRLNTFIKHYSLTEIENRFKILEEGQKEKIV